MEPEVWIRTSDLTQKERSAFKRRMKYRTDESYREKIKEKAEKSKQREEYKKNQKLYNRLYYQRMKEKLKERRESKKNTSFEDSLDVKNRVFSPPPTFNEGEEVVIETEEIEAVNHDQEEVFVKPTPERRPQRRQQNKAVKLEKEEVRQEDIIFYSVVANEEVVRDEPLPYHSYPRTVPRQQGRLKARRGVDKGIQAEFDASTQTENDHKFKDVVHVVDVGTQVCETDLTLNDVAVIRMMRK